MRNLLEDGILEIKIWCFNIMRSFYRVAIPSYKRSAILKRKTLTMLEREGYTPQDIDIFVSNEDEYKEYKALLPEYNFIITNTMGLTNKKNFITNYYDEGQFILSVDDDVSKMLYAPDSEYKSLREVALMIFLQMIEHDTILGAFYPVGNTMCMKNIWERGFVFALGSIYCYRIDKSILIDVAPEDNDRCIKVYRKYGTIVRYCRCAPITVYWKTKGGMTMSETDRSAIDHRDKKKLADENPDLCKLIQKKNGMHELKYNLKLKTRYECSR